MEDLTGQLNETTILALVRNNNRTILHMVECNEPLQVKAVMLVDVYDISTGRLLIAYFTAKDLESLLKAIGLPSKKRWTGAQSTEGL